MNVENFPGIRSFPDVIGVCLGIPPTRQETLDTSMETVIIPLESVCVCAIIPFSVRESVQVDSGDRSCVIVVGWHPNLNSYVDYW